MARQGFGLVLSWLFFVTNNLAVGYFTAYQQGEFMETIATLKSLDDCHTIIIEAYQGNSVGLATCGVDYFEVKLPDDHRKLHETVHKAAKAYAKRVEVPSLFAWLTTAKVAVRSDYNAHIAKNNRLGTTL